MPTPLILDYSASATIYLPNAIARKLKEHEGKTYGKPWTYYVKYNELRYWDGEGVEQRIEGSLPDSDYKYPEAEEWDDEEPESDDEESSSDEESECEFCGEEDKDDHECIPERRERDNQSHPIESPWCALGRSLCEATTVEVPIT